MSKTSIKRRRGSAGKGLTRMKRYVKALSRDSVEAGFFEELGVYPSKRNKDNWSYAELMAFHELEVRFTERRPIFTYASAKIPKALEEPITKELIKSLTSSLVCKRSDNPSHVFKVGGEIMVREIDKIFGKTPPLAKNSVFTANPTQPMIETGTLKDGLRYKNTKDKELQRATN